MSERVRILIDPVVRPDIAGRPMCRAQIGDRQVEVVRWMVETDPEDRGSWRVSLGYRSGHEQTFRSCAIGRMS